VSPLARAVRHALVIVAGSAPPPADAARAIRDYRRAGQALVAGHARRDQRVIQHLQEIPLTKTRREDALRLIEYTPRMTAAGRRREAAKDIREMRRRYGATETRRRLRVLARGGDLLLAEVRLAHEVGAQELAGGVVQDDAARLDHVPAMGHP
jgi:hypothetical protein